MIRSSVSIIFILLLSLQMSSAQTYINAGMVTAASETVSDDAVKNGDEAVAVIRKCFSRGDADGLSQYFDDNLDISIFLDSGTASKIQARRIMKSFFRDYRPSSFIVDNTVERANLKYVMATMTSGGDRFRVVTFLNFKDDTFRVQQIKISRYRR